MSKICLIAGSAPLYRKATFEMLENEFNCDFILANGPTQQMDINQLKRVKRIKETKFILNGIYTYNNLIKFSKDYETIIFNIAANNILYYLFPIIARLRGQKIISWTHGWYGKEGIMRKLIKRIYYSIFISKVLVYGEYAKKLMIKNGVSKDKVFVIHNSLDYYCQLELRKQLTYSNIYKEHFGNSNPVLIFIGRLRRVKKLDQVLDAMRILRDRDENYNLMLIGGGEDEDYLKDLVIKYGMEDCVWFYGPCYDEKVNAKLVYSADLCVAPGNIGLTAMHTLMFGCPALTHDNYPWQMPEFESIINGSTGDFFNYGNTLSLADKISEWFSKNIHNRDRVREACYREIDEHWNPEYQKRVIRECIQ